MENHRQLLGFHWISSSEWDSVEIEHFLWGKRATKEKIATDVIFFVDI